MWRIAALIVCLLLLGACRNSQENVLQEFAQKLKDSDVTTPLPIILSAKIKEQGNNIFLRFRLQNISSVSLELYPSELPWGNANSLTFVAFTLQGRTLSNHYPIDDPIFEKKVVIAPGEVLEGDYDLWYRLRIDSIPRDSDIVIIWAYQFEKFATNGKRPFPVTTGVAILSATKVQHSGY